MKQARWRLDRWLLGIVLSFVAVMGFYQSWYHTLTSDEAIHTSSAYLALTRGDHRFDPEHPFLFKYLTALPFLVYKTNLPADDAYLWQAAEPTLYDSWRESRTWSDRWVYESGNNPKVMQVLMRLPGVISLIVLTWFTWWLTRRWFGASTARWALFFTAVTPTLLAHGFTTNTDVPLALTFLVALWRLGEYWISPTRQNAAWVGAGLALALLTKFSSIALLPIALVWLIVTARKRAVGARHVVLDATIAAAVIVAAIWLTYFFKSPLTLLPNAVTNAEMAFEKFYGHKVALARFFNLVPHILPTAYTKGLMMVLNGGHFGRPTFLLNQTFETGVWFYFPVLFLLKSQLAVIMLSAVSFGVALGQVKRYKEWSWQTWLLTFGGGVFLLLALTSKLNLGIRHISPLLPLVAIALGAVMTRLQPLFRSAMIPALVIVASVLPVLVQSGNLIGFGNIMTGNGNERLHYFHDSNLDWGQSWERVAAAVNRESPDGVIYFPYYLSALAYYGKGHELADALHPGSEGAGVVVLGATELNNDYAKYKSFEPAAIVDNAYFIYKTDKLVPR